MSTLAEIEIAAAGLPAAEKRSQMSWLKAELTVENHANADGPRVPGLGKGKWQVADGFDAPLPDEFWLGASGAHKLANSPLRILVRGCGG